MLAYLARLSTRASRRSALSALRAVARLLGHEDPMTVPWHLLNAAHAAAVRGALAERYSPATANHRLAALRGALKASWRVGLIDLDTYARVADLPPVRGAVLPRGRALSPAEVRALFQAAASDPRPTVAARDAALLALAFGLGLRRAELVGLDRRDVDLEAGTVLVRGKGRRERVGYLHGGTLNAVAHWAGLRGDALGPLLLGLGRVGRPRPGRLSPSTVGRILARVARRAGVQPFTSHDARRTFITGLLDQGVDLAVVSDLAGHSSPDTTKRYDRRPDEARRRSAALVDVPFTPKSGPCLPAPPRALALGPGGGARVSTE